jgi:hypothetical protein
MGHFAFGAHELMGVNGAYITVVREPVARVISQYLFVKDRVTHPFYRRMQGMTLKDFVRSDVGAEVNNGQARLIAGTVHPDSATDEEALLNRAKENIETSFAVVGILEDFDRSLIAMKMKLGWALPYYTRVNLTRTRPSAKVIDDETIRLVRQYNSVDLQLYEYARQRLAAQWRSFGPAAESTLKRFRRINQPLQIIGTPARELVRRIKWWVYWMPRWRWQQRKSKGEA